MTRCALLAVLASLLVSGPASGSFAGANGAIAYTRIDDSGSSVVIVRPGTQGETVIARAAAVPAWSPDGRRVAFQTSGGPDLDIVVANADGSGAERIRLSGTDDFMAAWSPKGDRLVFARDHVEPEGGITRQAEIWTMNVDGTNRRRLTRNTVLDFFPEWSPNGRWIAYVRAARRTEIWLMRPDGTHKHRLLRMTANVGSPSWSPDSKRIAFDRSTGGPADIYVIRLGAKRATAVVRGPGDERLPTWSPDGMRIAFSRSTDSAESGIYVVDAGGGNEQRLDAAAGDSFGPDWQPLP